MKPTETSSIRSLAHADRSAWLPYARPAISESDIAAVSEALRQPMLTQGPMIEWFERQVAAYAGAKHAVAYSSGTAALHGAYFAAGVTAGSEIITPAMTFVATVNAAMYLGAVPRFADIEAKRGLIDPESARRLLSTNTKAIVGVDYAGYPCDADKLLTLARDLNAVFVRDAAHSLGASYNGVRVGSDANITIFSFHPTKLITTGEGGMALTNDDDFAEKLRNFRTHGIVKNADKLVRTPDGPWYHEAQNLGFNYRMSNINAALGYSQMLSIEAFLKRRREISAIYRSELMESKFYDCLPEEPLASSANHLFPILVKGHPYRACRRKLFEFLQSRQIGVQVHYIPAYRHPHFAPFLEEALASCPNTEEFYSREISLPIFNDMTNADAKYVLQVLREAESLFN